MKRIVSGLSLSALLCVGCGSGSQSSGFSSAGGGSGSSNSVALQTGSTSSRLLQDLQALAALVAQKGPSAKVLARATSDRAVNGTVPGPKGGSATLVGNFNIGADSNTPANSDITITFNQFQFADGLILDGGTVRFTSSLYGSETAAHGTTTLDAQNVNFSGTGTGSHSFKIEEQVVNSLPIKTTLTLDGVKRNFGFLVKISNFSSTPDDQVFITLVGKDGATPPTHWGYLAHADDESMTEFEDTPGAFLTKNSDGSFQGSEKYSFPLSDLTVVGDHVREMVVPQENLVSGRLFISFGRKLKGLGINSPYYNASGQPVTTPSSGSGTVTAGQAKVPLSINTSGLAVNEPVTFSLNSVNYSGKISAITGPSEIQLDPAPTQSGTATLSFTPSPGSLNGAKLALGFPSPTGPPDYLTTYDFVELSATTGGATPFYTLYTNTTAIDFFSVGLGMSARFAGKAPIVNGQAALAPSERIVGFGNTPDEIKAGITPRQKIFDRFNNKDNNQLTVPAEFQNFVTSQSSSQNTVDPHITIGRPTDPQADVIRVLGPPPIIALQPTGNLSKFLDGIIDETWTTFCTNAVNLTGGNAITYKLTQPFSFVFEGDTPGSSTTLNLKCTTASAGNSGQGDTYQLPKPTTRVVFECDDPLATGNDPNNYKNNYSDAHKRLASLILSAYQRAVFPNVPDWHEPGKFYTDSAKRYNFFSRVMHEFSLKGIVYGFAYDDVFGQDSTIAGPINLNVNNAVPESDNGNVVDLTLTIPNFQAAALPLPVTLKVELDTEARKKPAPEGCIAHFTTLDGATDKVVPLDASGSATFGDLSPNTAYTAWVSPGGPNASSYFFSYAVNGKYNGTLNGWNSSFGDTTPGLVRVKMGALAPGVGSSLSPQPNSPRGGGLPPLPVAGDGQADWGN